MLQPRGEVLVLRSWQSLRWPEKAVSLLSIYQKYKGHNKSDTFLLPVKRARRLYSLHLHGYQRHIRAQIKIALLNLFFGICMLRLIKYFNPILPPQYCLVPPLCPYLSFLSRPRHPSRDAMYAQNKNMKQMTSQRDAQNLYICSESRKFSFHFLHMSKKVFIYWFETGHNQFRLHYFHKTED